MKTKDFDITNFDYSAIKTAVAKIYTKKYEPVVCSEKVSIHYEVRMVVHGIEYGMTAEDCLNALDDNTAKK